MYGIAHPPLPGDNEMEWPRFLNREDSSGPEALAPPPLPGTSRLARTLNIVKRAPRVSTAAVAVFTMAAAGSAVLLAGVLSTHIPHPAAPAGLNEVADALHIVEQLETRLGYAGGLASHVQDIAGAIDGEVSAPSASVTAAAGDDATLVILRDLPTRAMLSASLPVGEGAWSEAAANPDQPVLTPRDGIDQLLTASAVEDLSSGLTLGGLNLDLRDGAVAAAEQAPAEQVTGSLSDTREAEAKPAKRTRHAHSRRAYKYARADGGRRRHGDRDDDTATAKSAAPSQQETKAATAEAAEKDANGEAKPAGPLAKFFAWLKGGSKTQPANVAEPSHDSPPGGYGLAPQQ